MQLRNTEHTQSSATTAQVSRTAGAIRLVLALGALGLVWLVALPWMAGRPNTAAYIQWLHEKGIDPSAMYYTELEMMGPLLNEMARENRINEGK